MSYPRRVLLALPYARLELPGWGRVLSRLGGFRDELWPTAPARRVRGKLHGYVMKLQLSNWSERQTYFTRRFYDLPTQLLMMRCLSAGDTFVDIGANIGMLALLGAHCVGPTGRVVAVEPNPQVLDRLRAVVGENDLGERVTIVPVGLSDAPGVLELSVVTPHTGMGTFADVADEDRHLVSAVHRVAVAVGDDVLADLPAIPTLVKIDVEGFEVRVLRGLDATIRRIRPCVVAEVVPDHLKRAGTTVAELAALMDRYGMRPYELRTRRRGLRHTLWLQPFRADRSPGANNVVWIPPRSTHEERLRGSMSDGG